MINLPHFDLSHLLEDCTDDKQLGYSVCVFLLPSFDFDLILCVRYRRDESGVIHFDPNIKEVVFENDF